MGKKVAVSVRGSELQPIVVRTVTIVQICETCVSNLAGKNSGSHADF